MTTVANLVDSSLRLIRAIDSGANAAASELADGVRALNIMLSGWSTGPLKIYVITRESFTLTSSVGTYTIGTGGALDTERPVFILNAFLRQDLIDYPLLVMNISNYADIALKSPAGMPGALYYETDFPLGKIIFDRVPDGAYGLNLYSKKPFTSYALDGSETISLPPGYARAIKYNLAVEISPEYSAEVPPLVLKFADESLSDIKRVNSQPVPIINTNPFNRGGSFDITTG